MWISWPVNEIYIIINRCSSLIVKFTIHSVCHCQSLPSTVLQSLVVSLVLSRLDYGNSTLAGNPVYQCYATKLPGDVTGTTSLITNTASSWYHSNFRQPVVKFNTNSWYICQIMLFLTILTYL